MGRVRGWHALGPGQRQRIIQHNLYEPVDGRDWSASGPSQRDVDEWLDECGRKEKRDIGRIRFRDLHGHRSREYPEADRDTRACLDGGADADGCAVCEQHTGTHNGADRKPNRGRDANPETDFNADANHYPDRLNNGEPDLNHQRRHDDDLRSGHACQQRRTCRRRLG